MSDVKKNWYDLHYGGGEGDAPQPTVLYASRSGVEALIGEMQRAVDCGEDGRVALDIVDMDYVYDVPFTHIEICHTPPDHEDDEAWSWRPFVVFGLLILGVVMLAGYGLVRLLMDVF